MIQTLTYVVSVSTYMSYFGGVRLVSLANTFYDVMIALVMQYAAW